MRIDEEALEKKNKGVFCNNRGKICHDKVEMWLVLAQEFANKSMKWSEKPIKRLEYTLKFSV